ncbi:tRNA-specific adenosine-34 deaminase [Lachnospiraceae bacterium TWA4]|nr:tRNA-specific adenosine-34 deaminase [Lachnospiraceae bacterium TWA4]
MKGLIMSINKFMKVAIDEARQGIHANHGGPFGSVIVKDGIIIGKGHNRVLINHDPTHHGEISAIRDACSKLKTHDLSGCEIYTTGEPCPMCLCACMWANIKKVYYGCTIDDNSKIGFRDSRFDKLLGGRENIKDYLVCIDRDACLELFDEYNHLKDHQVY